MLDKIADSLANRILKVGRSGITKPIFVKEFNHNKHVLKELTALANSMEDKKKRNKINREVIFLRQGFQGEANVVFELENSLIPMLCMHDVRIDYKGYTAQIDFLIITRSCIIVLETKKLVGDIEINRDGDFVRVFKNKFGKVSWKEGIYSPISQNERQLRILEMLLHDYKIITHTPVKSLVILANPKTILNKRYAPKHIQNNIYKYDQLSRIIQKEIKDNLKTVNLLDKKMYEITDLIMKYNRPKSFLDNYKEELAAASVVSKNQSPVDELEKTPLENAISLEEMLRTYRLEVSKIEGIKAYMVFTNNEMMDLIEGKPKTKAALLEIKGFGKVKTEKYGDRIIEIIKRF